MAIVNPEQEAHGGLSPISERGKRVHVNDETLDAMVRRTGRFSLVEVAQQYGHTLKSFRASLRTRGINPSLVSIRPFLYKLLVTHKLESLTLDQNKQLSERLRVLGAKYRLEDHELQQVFISVVKDFGLSVHHSSGHASSMGDANQVSTRKGRVFAKGDVVQGVLMDANLASLCQSALILCATEIEHREELPTLCKDLLLHVKIKKHILPTKYKLDRIYIAQIYARIVAPAAKCGLSSTDIYTLYKDALEQHQSYFILQQNEETQYCQYLASSGEKFLFSPPGTNVLYSFSASQILMCHLRKFSEPLANSYDNPRSQPTTSVVG